MIMSISFRNLEKWQEALGKKVTIVVGFPKEHQVIYPPDDRVGHHNKGGQSVASVASIQEFGSRKNNIPSRPFLRHTIKQNKQKILELIKQAYTYPNILSENKFDRVGIALVNMVKDSIRNGPWEPNALATKLQKLTSRTQRLVRSEKPAHKARVEAELGKIKPLIDRGIMINYVSYSIREK